MIHLDDERLVDLALGAPAEAGDDAHARSCHTCGALLESLIETIGVTRAGSQAVLVDPPARVWQAIESELWSSPAATPPQTSATPERRGETTSHGPPSLAARRRHRAAGKGFPVTWLLAAACVLGVVLGVGGATVANRVGGTPEPSDLVLASASLTPLDSDQSQAVASLVDREGELRLNLPAMGLDAGDGYLEVWLINRDLTRMISVGVLPADAPLTVLPVSQELLDQGYVIVDISREPFDDQPAHSGQTLVRGELSV